MKLLLVAILTFSSISSYANCDISVLSERVNNKTVKKLKKVLKRQGYKINSGDPSTGIYTSGVWTIQPKETYAILGYIQIPGGLQLGMEYKLNGQNKKVVAVNDSDLEAYFPKCVE